MWNTIPIVRQTQTCWGHSCQSAPAKHYAEGGEIIKSFPRLALILALVGCGIPESETSVLNDAEARASARSRHDALFNGILNSDVESLSQLLDDDLTLSYPDGRLGTKDDLLERLAEGTITYDSADIKPAQLRLYDDIAIFNGLSTTLVYVARRVTP